MNVTMQRIPSRLRVLIVLVAGAFVIGLLSFAHPPAALASCSTPSMAGAWQNIDPNTRSLTRVSVGFECGDQVLCDTDGHCTGGDSYFTLHPYGKCHPSDCDWGARRAQDMGSGWQRATFSYSWATKYVWVKTYTYGGRLYLRVYTWTDYTAADGRTDYSTDEWMLK
ncbi:hypothetical protein [Microlunatus ginsengisoli]|uniref:Peptidase inhibitor family I36 n=1 Tax=Microlunatus ginsengisoli TaxID=363863 RepID=A0ABP6ZQQ0_9ACTN